MKQYQQQKKLIYIKFCVHDKIILFIFSPHSLSIFFGYETKNNKIVGNTTEKKTDKIFSKN